MSGVRISMNHKGGSWGSRPVRSAIVETKIHEQIVKEVSMNNSQGFRGVESSSMAELPSLQIVIESQNGKQQVCGVSRTVEWRV